MMKRKNNPAFPPLFKLVFVTAVAVILASWIMSIVIAYTDAPTSMQSTLFQNCLDAWKMGVAALIGLIGGRADIK